MSYAGMEDIHLTYYKLLDGIDTSVNLGVSGVVDLSFNDFVTARYLVDNKGFRSVSALTDLKMINYEGINPVRIDRNLSFTLRKLKTDLVISLGGTFRFQPVHDAAYAIHGCLNVGGSVILAVYPTVYDRQGRDMLAAFSAATGIPVRDKLGRWYSTLFNTMSNLFVNIRTEEVLSDTTSAEVMSVFSTDSFYRYLFRDNTEYDKFFSLAGDGEGYILSWKIIKGLKV
ncbi:MAG: hypothetical protein LRY50_11300 [Geovibrio sp.]|nr:hypothetical protein [Geovibrio sp.]